MKIEEGKFYRTRDGRKVGPMEVGGLVGEWDFEADVDGQRTIDGTYCAWRADGSFDPLDRKTPHRLDLISEWSDGPVRTITRQEIVPGTYDGVEVGSEVTGHPQREVMVRIAIDHGPMVCMNADQLERAAAVLTALADALKASEAPR